MRGGQLDRCISIESNAPTTGEYGPQPGAWTPIANGSRIAAQVQHVLPSKAESTSQGMRVAMQPARVRIRYLRTVKASMRVVFHDNPDRIMQIVAGPAEIGRREWTEFVVTEYST